MASVGGRATLVTVDQVLSGASNIFVVLLIAHLLSPADFGRFTLIFLAYSSACVIGRSLICATILVHPHDADSRPRAILGSSLFFAVAIGIMVLAVALPLHLKGSAIGTSLLWLSLFIPLMLIQDVGRFIAIANHRPVRAVWLDGLWIVVEVAAFLVVIVRDEATLSLSVAIWAASGALSGLMVFVQSGFPRLSELDLTWLRSRWTFSWRAMVTGVTSEVSALIGFTAIALVSSGVVVGAVRAVLLLTRPGNIVITSVATSGIVDMSRDRPDNDATRMRIRRTVLVSVAAAVLNTVVLVFLPDRVGQLVLGQTWDVAEPLLLAAGLQLVLIAARNGIRVALMSRREIRLIMAIDIVGSVALIVLSLVGALIAEAEGVMWANVAGQGALSIAWWGLGRRRLNAGSPQVEESIGSELNRPS